jgi:hypothetical protein
MNPASSFPKWVMHVVGEHLKQDTWLGQTDSCFADAKTLKAATYHMFL